MRTISFNVGPSQLSDEVQRDIVAVNESGILMESHRGPVVQDLLRRTCAKLKQAMALPDDYTVLFLQGGASSQFLMVPWNLLQGGAADYIEDGDSSANEVLAFMQEMILNGQLDPNEVAQALADLAEADETPEEQFLPEGIVDALAAAL